MQHSILRAQQEGARGSGTYAGRGFQNARARRRNALRRNVLQEPVGSLDVADRLVSHRQVHYLIFDDERKVVPGTTGFVVGKGR